MRSWKSDSSRGAFLEDFLELALDFHAHGEGALHLAAALAIRAVVIDGGADAFAVALAGHFHEAELRDGQDVGLGLVAAQTVLHALIDLLAVAARFHVNEVEHDEAAHVAEAKLAADFLGGFQVDLEDGGFLVAAALVAAGVHVNGHERLGFVNDDVAAALQMDLAREGVLQLLADVEAVEDGLAPRCRA